MASVLHSVKMKECAWNVHLEFPCRMLHVCTISFLIAGKFLVWYESHQIRVVTIVADPGCW